jgi:hypothetical protein
MEEQLESFKPRYLELLNNNHNRYDFNDQVDEFYNENKEEILNYLSTKTNGGSPENYDNIEEHGVYRPDYYILYEYFYFGTCPSLMKKPEEVGFKSFYFMWVKRNDPLLKKKFIKDKDVKPLKNIKDVCSEQDIEEENIKKIADLIGLQNGDKSTLCTGIADYFKKMSNEMQSNVSKCITESTLSGDAISDVHPLFFTMYQQGNHMHCGDIRELVRLKKNPMTNIPFTKEQNDLFHGKMKVLESFVENLDDPEEIIMTVSSLINNAASEFINQLRYPNSQDLYVKASPGRLNKFINELLKVGILNSSDTRSLDPITIDSTKKITLANVLMDKLKNASDLHYIGVIGISSVGVTLEEVYNNIFDSMNV